MTNTRLAALCGMAALLGHDNNLPSAMSAPKSTADTIYQGGSILTIAIKSIKVTETIK